jgi:hypothetical protein
MVAVRLRRRASLVLSMILLGAVAVVVFRPGPRRSDERLTVTSAVPARIQIGSTVTVAATA